jgi:hypothetical protein
MIPCLPEHIGKNPCPECGESHEQFLALPDRPLSMPDCRQLIREKKAVGVMPIFRIHTRENYQKAVPAVVLVSGGVVKVLWFNPNTDDNWVTVFEETDVEAPFALGAELGENLRESTYEEETVADHEVVYPDEELMNAVDPARHQY